MSTHRLYYADAYQTEFDAQVVALREDGWAALDQSAFYPTSGGQPLTRARWKARTKRCG